MSYFSSTTPTLRQGDENFRSYIIHCDAASSAHGLEDAASATPIGARILDRFNMHLLPLAAVAIFGFGNPLPRAECRFYSRPGITISVFGREFGHLDEFIYTQEMISAEHARALDALLALPIAEGFSLYLDD